MASYDFDARTFKPGEILDAAMHYTARNPHFFRVTRNSGKSIWARPIRSIVVSHDGYGQNGQKMPDLTDVGGDEVMGRIGKRGYVHLNGNLAVRWDGQPSNFYTD